MNSQQSLRQLSDNFELDNFTDEKLLTDFSALRSDFMSGLEFDIESYKTCYILFAGHRGCGKSTELRGLKKIMEQREKPFHVVLMQIEQDLNLNNIEFTDLCLLLLGKLLESVENVDTQLLANINPIYTDRIKDLFNEKIITQDERTEYGIDTSVGLKTFFIDLSTRFKNTAQHTESIRQRVTTYFSDIASQFNLLFTEIEKKLEKPLLFIIDGTDRLNSKDAVSIFIERANFFKQLKSRFVYAAPIRLTLQDNLLNNYYKCHHLPMIPIFKSADEAKNNRLNPECIEPLKDLISKRLPFKYFENNQLEAIVQILILNSGGCLRHIVVLLSKLWRHACLDKQFLHINTEIMNQIAHTFANEHLYSFDSTKRPAIQQVINDPYNLDDNIRELLHQLIIVEYNGNGFWRFPHPALRLAPQTKELFNTP